MFEKPYVVEIDEKRSYNVIPGHGNTLAVEKVFKGRVSCHVIFGGENGKAIAEEITRSKDSWKEAVEKHKLLVMAGKS
ncbi:MAG: hypothetical protein GY796_36505 [Chloroflexi bacterium]|nr:hypothetical protein [Chloroflexota bacterium]